MENGVIKPHPYCRKCGTIKNISSDRGKKMGYFIVVLSNLKKELESKGYKISEAQMRNITNELSRIDGFDDVWWITLSKQKEIFIKVVRKYVKVSERVIERHVDLAYRNCNISRY